MSESSTFPLKVALTGPIFILATAAKPLSPVFSNDSQPGIQALRTTGSLSSAHTFGRAAGRVASPVIVIGMNVPPFGRWLPRGGIGPARRRVTIVMRRVRTVSYTVVGAKVHTRDSDLLRPLFLSDGQHALYRRAIY